MDSTERVGITCDACPFRRGCPVFARGRRACLLGVWPITAMFCGLSALALGGHLLLGW